MIMFKDLITTLFLLVVYFFHYYYLSNLVQNVEFHAQFPSFVHIFSPNFCTFSVSQFFFCLTLLFFVIFSITWLTWSFSQITLYPIWIIWLNKTYFAKKSILFGGSVHRSGFSTLFPHFSHFCSSLHLLFVSWSSARVLFCAVHPESRIIWPTLH